MGVLELAGAPGNVTVKVKSLDSFFKVASTEQNWMTSGEKAEVENFKQLVQTIKDSLAEVKVFQIGKPESDVYIVGRTDSGWAGLRTTVVET
jgi:hypothetical protein